MTTLVRKKKEKIGGPPGSLVHTGNSYKHPVVINRINYTEDFFEETDNIDIDQLVLNDTQVTWIEVLGVHQGDVVEKIGQKLNLHPLFLEDVMNVRHRPKVDNYGDGLFITLRLLDYDEITQKIIDEQISFFLRKNLLISFREQDSNMFDSVKERLRTKKGIIRRQGADFLTYTLIDTVIDYYFVLLNKMSDAIEKLESDIPHLTTHLKDIHDTQRQIVFLRKSIWPVREVINSLMREDEETILLSANTRFYLKDVYDHAIQVIETLDLLRELCKGILDINISTMSHRMNEVIKILTVVSTIFVPLTFITSLYGMNFLHMPELSWRYGYAGVWLVMIGVALFMIRYFRKKKWF